MSRELKEPEEQSSIPRFVPPPPSKEYTPPPSEPLPEDPVTHRRLRETKTDFTVPPGVIPLPLKNDDHALTLLNIAHKNHRPRSRYPGFRILGAFPDTQTMQDHISKYYDNSECSLLAVPTHQLMPIFTSTEKQQDITHVQKHTELLVDLYSKHIAKTDSDFKENINASKGGKVGESLYGKGKAKSAVAVDTKFEETVKELKKTGSLSGSACIAKQNFAVIIIIPDSRPEALSGLIDKEPLLSVLDVFATEDDATKYAKYTASKQYPKCTIDVVDMYAWGFPEHVDTDKIQEVYGSDQLNDIMSGRKDNASMTEAFQKWCAENNIKPQVTELGGEKKESAKVTEDEHVKKDETIIDETLEK